MKTNSIIIALFAVFSLAFTNPAAVESYSVDTQNSKVAWVGYKVTGKHNGSVAVKEGSLDFQDGQLKGGSFAIDMTTIKVLDLTGEYAGKLEGHLKSDDFFGVNSYPTATFTITKVVPQGPGKYKVLGDLKIKETTKEIKFTANVAEEDGNQVANAKITIDRSDFDVRYGSGSFFDNLGDNTIYDEFELEVSLVATK